MSVSIMWKPVKNEGRYLGKSFFLETLEKVFGKLPQTFTNEHLERLHTIHALHENEDGFKTLIEAILEYGKIEVWAEY